MNREQKRLYLRVTVKLMLLVLVAGLGLTLLRSVPSSGDTTTTMRVDLSQLRIGEVIKLEWDKRRVLVLRREQSQASLPALDEKLLDPTSRHSSQPEFAETPWRSMTREFFIALDYGTDLNCELDYLGADDATPTPDAWQGGFRDRCRGSWYDHAGRVYRDQHALRNLMVPSYRIEGHELILGE